MTEADARLRSGIVAGLAAYLVWGGLTMYWKLLHRFDAFELVAWRVISASATMAVVLTATRRWVRLRPVVRDRRLLVRVVLAAVLLTVNWTSYVWAVVHGHVIETALGYFMSPLGTIAVGVVVFGEPLRRAQRMAVALAGAAVIVLAVAHGRVPIAALLIAGSWSCYGWLKKEVPLEPLESMSAESLVLLPLAAVTIAVVGGDAGSVADGASAGHVLLVALSGLATVVPLTLFARAAHRVPLTVLGPMQYLVPSINFLLGWLLYDEALPASRLAGFALVWAGLVVMTLDSVRRRHDWRSATNASDGPVRPPPRDDAVADHGHADRTRRLLGARRR